MMELHPIPHLADWYDRTEQDIKFARVGQRASETSLQPLVRHQVPARRVSNNSIAPNGSGWVFPPVAIRAERGGRRGCSGSCRDSRAARRPSSRSTTRASASPVRLPIKS